MFEKKSTQRLLVINPEYSESVPALTAEEFKALKDSIQSQGQHLPIIVNKEFVILDGHHRFRICQELNLAAKYEIKEFPTVLHEQLFVIDCNLQRRQLNDYNRGVLTLKAKPILQQIAKMNQGTRTDLEPVLNISHLLGRVDEQIGQKAGLSYGTIRKIEFIEQNATEEVKQKLREDKTTISKVYFKIQIQQKRQLLINEAANIELPNNDNCQLHNQDFCNIGPDIIPDNSIDLIFTDPPYGYDSISLQRPWKVCF